VEAERRLASVNEAERAEGKPRLLILNAGHCDGCHLGDDFAGFETQCALADDVASAPVGDYDVIVVYALSIPDLCKWSLGVPDDRFTSLACEALLLGKKIIVDKNGVDLLRRPAAGAYYDALCLHIKRLQDFGVIFAGDVAPALREPNATDDGTRRDVAIVFDKRLITEKDVRLAVKEGFAEIEIPAEAIVTMLAKDYARERGVKLKIIRSGD